MASPASILRPARAADAETLGALWATAFPGERSAEARSRALIEDSDPYGGLDDAWVAEEEGDVVGGVRTYRLGLHLGGRLLPALGIGAVAVRPDRRRRGLGRRICVEALRIGRDRGDVLAVLYPFRVDWYRRLGFALAGERHRFRFRPGEIDVTPAGGYGVEPTDGETGGEAIRDVYAEVAGRSNGMMRREERHWRRRLSGAGEAWLARDREGRPRGYLLAGTEESGGGRTLRIDEWVSADAPARRAAAAWLGGRDDVDEVSHDALPSERLEEHLAHPIREGSAGTGRLWFECAGRLRGPMVRLLHPRALGGRGLAIRDPLLSANDGVWDRGERLDPDPLDPAAGPGEAALLLLRETPAGEPPVSAASPEGTGAPAFDLLDEF